jgi:hypothetical protein
MALYITNLLTRLLFAWSALTQSSATVSVTAHVHGNISVTPTTSDLYSVFIDDSNTGQIKGCLCFEVIANQPEVFFQVKATDLYSNPSNPRSKIPLTNQGATITRFADVNSDDQGTRLEWADNSSLNGLPARVSRLGTFKSLQPFSFHEEITVHVSWDQFAHDLPAGTYTGYIKLIGFLLPG